MDEKTAVKFCFLLKFSATINIELPEAVTGKNGVVLLKVANIFQKVNIY